MVSRNSMVLVEILDEIEYRLRKIKEISSKNDDIIIENNTEITKE